MSVVKQAVSILLLAGSRVGEGERVTARLFIHYLGGSGDAVTLHNDALTEHCTSAPRTWDKGYKWGVIAPGAYVNAVGGYTCYPDGTGYDLYDFESWELDPKICSRLYKVNTLYKLRMLPPNLGRCITSTGVGKPYTIQIK
jgi:hypothetical protein